MPWATLGDSGPHWRRDYPINGTLAIRPGTPVRCGLQPRVTDVAPRGLARAGLRPGIPVTAVSHFFLTGVQIRCWAAFDAVELS